MLHEPALPLTVEGVAGVTFYPCPVLVPHDVADPTAWIPEQTILILFLLTERRWTYR